MNCICISKKLGSNEIRTIFAKVFEVERDVIGIIADVEEFLSPDNFEIRIVVIELPGEFPQWYDIYSGPELTDQEIALRLISLIQVDVLISDDSVNPYSWILVSAKKQSVVFVDANFLDEQGGFRIGRDEQQV